MTPQELQEDKALTQSLVKEVKQFIIPVGIIVIVGLCVFFAFHSPSTTVDIQTDFDTIVSSEKTLRQACQQVVDVSMTVSGAVARLEDKGVYVGTGAIGTCTIAKFVKLDYSLTK